MTMSDELRSVCRNMETRLCPPSGPCKNLCARFESDDPTPWRRKPAKITSLLENGSGEVIGTMVIREDGTFDGRFNPDCRIRDVLVKLAREGMVNALILKPKLIPATPAPKPCEFTHSHTRHFCGNESCRES